MSCGKTDRERSKIPPAPVDNDKIRVSAAIEALTDAIRSSPSVSENYYKRAQLYLKTESLQDALEDINRADRLKQNTGKYLFVKALILRAMNNYRESLAFAQSAEILNVDTPELYTLLGDLAQRKGDYARAEEYLAKSLQIAPYDGEIYYYKGTLAARKGDTVLAVGLMNKATQLKPRFYDSYDDIVKILRNRGLYDSALAINQKAMRYFPEKADLVINKATIYQRIGKVDTAMALYDIAIRMDSLKTDAMIFAGGNYFRWKNYTKALDYYTRAYRVNRNIPRINFLIGYCYEQLGSLTQADQYYRLAVQKDPRDDQAMAAATRVSAQISEATGVYTAPPVRPRKAQQPVPAPTTVVEEPKKLLDTSRVRINVITPKAKVNIKSDSSRRIKIN